MTDPIDNIEWIPSRKLKANGWNPNYVFDQELALLEESILSFGWIFPIIVNKNGLVIDGFHRWGLSMTSQELVNKYAEEVPCVVLDIDDKEAMMMTVRMNRARGTHTAFKMSELVQTLVEDYGVTSEEMMTKMGMTSSEIELLLDGSLIKRKKLKEHKFNKAWIPVEK